MTQIPTTDLTRFIRRYSLGRDSNPLNPTESLHFLRIKVLGGFIISEQFRHVADLPKHMVKAMQKFRIDKTSNYTG